MVAATKDRIRDAEFGQRIQQRREELGLTIVELAARLGLTYGQIVRYEMGETSLRASMLPPLAMALEVPIEYVFGQGPDSVEAFPPGALECARRVLSLHDEAVREDLLKVIKSLSSLTD